MRVRLPVNDIVKIGDAVDCALSQAFGNPQSSEPQLVANLVYELPNHINKVALSGTTKVAAAGIFVHARPFVSCASFPDVRPGSVEIGDLLLIRTLVINGTVMEQRALLLQAKKTDYIAVAPDNRNQWHLYEQWPGFTYAARSGSLKDKKRHIKEPDMYEAAKYLLIASDPAARCWNQMWHVDWPYHQFPHRFGVFSHYTAHPTNPELSRYRCFASELIEFLIDDAGKAFDKPKSRTRGWDRVIQDLIDETSKARTIFMGRATKKIGMSTRGSGVLFMSLPNDFSFFSILHGVKAGKLIKRPDVPEAWGDDDDGGEISIIEVVIEQGES